MGSVCSKTRILLQVVASRGKIGNVGEQYSWLAFLHRHHLHSEMRQIPGKFTPFSHSPTHGCMRERGGISWDVLSVVWIRISYMSTISSSSNHHQEGRKEGQQSPPGRKVGQEGHCFLVVLFCYRDWYVDCDVQCGYFEYLTAITE